MHRTLLCLILLSAPPCAWSGGGPFGIDHASVDCPTIAA
jgi:hypothetical protein